MKHIDRRGFTLFELMIAITLVSLMLTVVYGTYRVTLLGSQQCQRQLTLYREAASLCEKLKVQLAACQPITDWSNNGESGFVLESNNRSAQLSFITSQPLFSPPVIGGLYQVSWQVNTNGQLFYREEPFITLSSDNEPTSPPDKEIVISQMGIDLKFEAYDTHGQLSPSWQDRTESCPKALSIDLTVYDPAIPDSSFTLHTLAPVLASPVTRERLADHTGGTQK